MKKLFLIFLLYANRSFTQPRCDTTQLPIVFVHGFMGSGDNWALQVQRFSSNGFCEDRMFVFDWNTLGGNTNNDSLLNVFIDEVRMKTGSSQVNLVGHSAGGGLCYRYLNDPLHALKVAHYAHIGSMKMKAAAGKNAEVPTMNIYSTGDQVMKGGREIPGAVNVKQEGNDHLQVATGEETFANMYAFFTGRDEKVSTGISPSKERYMIMGGRGVVLAENSVLVTDSFMVRLINPLTGKTYYSKNPETAGSFNIWKRFSADGSWKIRVVKDNYTEIEVRPSGGRRLYYYFEPQKRNNRHVYLRALPVSGMAASMLGNLPTDSLQSALVIFTGNNAVIAGRDSLSIDSIPLSLPALMPASKTSIATFVFDDGDGVSSGNAIKTLSMAPFLTGVDIFIKADENKTMRVYYNGRSILIPKRKSRDGIMIVVFN